LDSSRRAPAKLDFDAVIRKQQFAILGLFDQADRDQSLRIGMNCADITANASCKLAYAEWSSPGECLEYREAIAAEGI
jgi:hypothetical protein